MNTRPSRSQGMRILAFAGAALFSTTALAASLTWQFGGQASDSEQTPFAALMSFDRFQSPVFTQTMVVEGSFEGETFTSTIQTEIFGFSSLVVQLGESGQRGAESGEIVQVDQSGLPGTISDTYTIEAIFGPGPTNEITATLTMDFAGEDLFNSLLTDVGVLQNNLPGTFRLSDYFGQPIEGIITEVSDLTAIPEPWTFGLLASGLGSLTLLSWLGIRARRAR